MSDKEVIKKMCIEIVPSYISIPGIDMPKFMWALAGVESSWNLTPNYRVEPAYSPPRGKYWINNKKLLRARTLYGEKASASLGTWQIMYITAREIGLLYNPVFFEKAENCLYAACLYLRKRANSKLDKKFLSKMGQENPTPEQLADAYNSGTYRDHIIPEEYIQKAMKYYKGEW